MQWDWMKNLDLRQSLDYRGFYVNVKKIKLDVY